MQIDEQPTIDYNKNSHTFNSLHKVVESKQKLFTKQNTKIENSSDYFAYLSKLGANFNLKARNVDSFDSS